MAQFVCAKTPRLRLRPFKTSYLRLLEHAKDAKFPMSYDLLDANASRLDSFKANKLVGQATVSMRYYGF